MRFRIFFDEAINITLVCFVCTCYHTISFASIIRMFAQFCKDISIFLIKGEEIDSVALSAKKDKPKLTVKGESLINNRKRNGPRICGLSPMGRCILQVKG